MNLTLVNNLIEKFVEASHMKINHYELFNEKGRYLNETYDSLEFFLDRLYDTGNFANFIFTVNSLPKEKFQNLINDLSFPIVCFKHGPDFNPVLITKAGKNFQLIDFIGTSIKESETKILHFESYQLVKEVNANYTYAYGRTKDFELDEEIFFVTGFPIEPLLSDVDKDSEYTKSSNESKKTTSHTANENHSTPFKRLLRLMNIERREISYIYFFAVLVSIVNLALPLGIQSVISLLSGGQLLGSIVVLTLVMVAATAFSGYLTVLQVTFVELLQQRVFAKAAYEFSFRIPKIKLEAISKEYGPELVNRFFDVINIQKSLPKFLIDITAASLQIIFGLILLSFYHPIFVFFAIILVVLIVAVIFLTGKKGMESSISESKYKYKVAYWLEELARNANTFKLAGYTNLTIEKTDIYLSNYLVARNKHFKVLKGQYITIVSFKVFITAGLLILGGALVINSQINLGQFIAAELIIVLVIYAVEKLILTLDVIYDLLTALDKVGHVTDLPLEDTHGIKLGAFVPEDDGYSLEFKNVSYKYEDVEKPIFQDLNFTISPNEKVCICGHNNSGKSTLIKIICGLLHNYDGSFTVNGLPMRDINIFSYRDTIGENLSHDEIFEGTIEENITVGKNGISLESLMWAIKEVGLNDFLQRQPQGLRTRLVGGGRDLASNIRQKIILARSIAEKPKMLVMDDEVFTEQNEKKQLQRLFFTHQNDWSLVMVTNDPMLLSNSDKVLFLHNGTIYKQGPFTEMLKDDDFAKLIIGNKSRN
ncbi:MAG: peptidase domain-containing ABC transporter [Cytophagales bacterium]